MAIFKREFVAVPDDKKDQLVYKWPDHEIRRFTRAIVAPDETAVFIRQGEVMGTLQPGRYTVDATELPFLGAFADTLSGGNMYRTELYFVSSRQVLDRFGGQIDEVQDPQTGLLVTLRVFGEYVIKVTDGASRSSEGDKLGKRGAQSIFPRSRRSHNRAGHSRNLGVGVI